MSAVLTNSIHAEGKSAMSTARKTKLALGLMQASALVTVLMLASPAQAQITFQFTYTDPGGVGFNAANPLGDARKLALVQTGQLITDLFPNYTATIQMSVNGAETNDATLAAAGSAYTSTPASTCAAGFNPGDVGIKVLGAPDPSPMAADGTITVNFQDHMWDLDDTIDPGQMDFKSTMLHEILHAMDFAHSVTDAGADGCGQAAPAAGGWAPYDQHLGNTTATFINGSFVINTTAWTTAVNGGTGNAGVLWRGTNAVAANSGAGVPLFSPNPIQSGSSISHLDDDFFTSVALLMEAATGPGQGTRTLSPIEVGMFRDMGYVNTVPVELESFSVD